jgi:hypothetical protein
MDAVVSSARQVRSQHRHELRALTYVTLDQANGGIVRNLSHSGIGVQVVAAVRPQQHLRVRFELRYPRLQVEAQAEVVWATLSGQCGIRFLDMTPALKRQVNEWILGDLLEGISLHAEHSGSMFAPKNSKGLRHDAGSDNGAIAEGVEEEEEDGLMVSAVPVKVIELPPRQAVEAVSREQETLAVSQAKAAEFDWLSQPLSGRALAWTVDTLVVVAALLLFTLVFLSVTREAPRWPLAMMLGAALGMAGLYWGFFRVFAGRSLGSRLARIAEIERENEADQARFR